LEWLTQYIHEITDHKHGFQHNKSSTHQIMHLLLRTESNVRLCEHSTESSAPKTKEYPNQHNNY